MPLLFSLTQCGLSDLKAGEVCQKQAEAVPEKPATSRLFNASSLYKVRPLSQDLAPAHTSAHIQTISLHITKWRALGHGTTWDTYCKRALVSNKQILKYLSTLHCL